jgi:hypothetical protein
MFVESLAERDPVGFRSFVVALHRGEGFREAFEGRLGQTVADSWDDFVASIGDTQPPTPKPNATPGAGQETSGG